MATAPTPHENRPLIPENTPCWYAASNGVLCEGVIIGTITYRGEDFYVINTRPDMKLPDACYFTVRPVCVVAETLNDHLGFQNVDDELAAAVGDILMENHK